MRIATILLAVVANMFGQGRVTVTFDNGQTMALNDFRFLKPDMGLTDGPDPLARQGPRFDLLPMDGDPGWRVPAAQGGVWYTIDLAQATEIWLRRYTDNSVRHAEILFGDGSRTSAQLFVGSGAWPPLPRVILSGVQKTFNRRDQHRYSLDRLVFIRNRTNGVCSVSEGGDTVDLIECRMEYENSGSGEDDSSLALNLTVDGKEIRIPFDQIVRVNFDDSLYQRGPVKVTLRSGGKLRGVAQIGAIRGYSADRKFVLTKILHRGAAVVREVAFQ